MRFSRPIKRPLIFLLVQRGVMFLSVLCAFTVFLYAAGTRQNFTDRSQFLLLNISMVLGIVLSIGVILGIVLDLYFFWTHKDKAKHLIKDIIVYVFLGIFSVSTVLIATFILVTTRGNTV